MAMNSERRISKRSHFTNSLMVADCETETFYDGKLENCSKDGMLFMSDMPMKPGAQIYVQTQIDTPFYAKQDDYDGCRAEVVWCKENKDNPSMYEIGTHFSSPDLQDYKSIM